MKKTNKTTNGINLDYDYNTEYGDGDIPDIDKNCSKNYSQTKFTSTENMIPDDVERRDGPGGE